MTELVTFPTNTGTTGIEVWLLLTISLAFNAVTVVCTLTAICCHVSMKCAEWKMAKKSAMKEYYFITKYGEKVHSTEKCPTLSGSFDIRTFRPCTKCFHVVEGGSVPKKTE